MIPAPAIVSTIQVEIARPASDPAFIAECNAWTDAHSPAMSDAELDALWTVRLARNEAESDLDAMAGGSF